MDDPSKIAGLVGVIVTLAATIIGKAIEIRKQLQETGSKQSFLDEQGDFLETVIAAHENCQKHVSEQQKRIDELEQRQEDLIQRLLTLEKDYLDLCKLLGK